MTPSENRNSHFEQLSEAYITAKLENKPEAIKELSPREILEIETIGAILTYILDELEKKP